MLKQYSFRSYPEMRFASRDRKRAASAKHTPRQNHLLAALPAEDYERLLPDLEPFSMPLGWIVHTAGDWEKHLYFLTEGIVSRYCVTHNGASAGIAITGSEGVIGVSMFLGGEHAPTEAVMLSAGYAYRLGADLLKSKYLRGGPLLQVLLRYTQALITQAGQTAVCNRHHSVEQRLYGFILSMLDRLPSNRLTMTHELMAEMLGVRREGVTEAAAKLQKAGLIQYTRGRIAVLDRSQLEAQVCECYSVVKREFGRLLPNSGKPKSLL